MQTKEKIEPGTYSVDETAQRLGASRAHTYDLIREEIPSLRFDPRPEGADRTHGQRREVGRDRPHHRSGNGKPRPGQGRGLLDSFSSSATWSDPCATHHYTIDLTFAIATAGLRLIARLCRDGIEGTGNAWRRRWPAPKARRPAFEVVRM